MISVISFFHLPRLQRNSLSHWSFIFEYSNKYKLSSHIENLLRSRYEHPKILRRAAA